MNPEQPPNFRDFVRLLDEITADLVSWQHVHDDGGWSATKPHSGGIHRSDTSEVWATAEIVLWLLQYDAERYREAILRGLTYLGNVQHVTSNVDGSKADGGWGWKLEKESEATATALAVLAFLESARVFNNPSAYTRIIEQGRDWLLHHVSEGGGFGALPNSVATALNTCWGSLALQRCVDMDAFTDPRITTFILPDAVKLVESTRTPEGWGSTLTAPPDTLGTAYAAYFLLQMHSPDARFGLTALRNTQLEDGSWDGGTNRWAVEATAWATHVQLLGGVDPRSPRIEAAVRYLRSLYVPHMGWPLRPGGEFKPWTTSFVCLALLQYVDALRRLDTPAHGATVPTSRSRRKVFIVHGQDRHTRDNVAEYLGQLGLEPIVLEKEAHGGVVSIYDKFQRFASQDGVDYAVVLCTPDDLVDEGPNKGPRRNVLFELGWFLGKLGPERVCLLSNAGIVLPSDLTGVAYIDLGADWLERLRRELAQAGLLV